VYSGVSSRHALATTGGPVLIGGLRQMGLHAGELAGIKPVAHGDSETDVEALAGLHVEVIVLRRSLYALFENSTVKQVIVQIESLHAVNEWMMKWMPG